MANVNNITSNSYNSSNSLYGNRNVLTGLASGMDTETMIQNSITGYQTKISDLQKSQTKLEWKQDAVREITDQLYNITQKYTSYTSKTNLSSNSFFSNNVNTTTNGTYAAAVSATGRTSSEIQINAVRQLATAARYSVDVSALDVKSSAQAAGSAINWGDSVKMGVLNGTMSLKIGSDTVEIKFDEEDQYTTVEEMVEGINKKLAEIDINSKKNGTIKAGTVITAEVDGSGITFKSNSADGDKAYISSVSGNLKNRLNVQTPTSSADENRFSYTGFSINGSAEQLTETKSMAEYLSGKSLSVTLDNTTKKVTIGNLSDTMIEVNGESKRIGALTEEELSNSGVRDKINEALVKDLQASLNTAFGDKKVVVGTTETGYSGGLKFTTTSGAGVTLSVESDAGGKLGIGGGVSNYFATSQKLGDLVGEAWLQQNAIMKVDSSEITKRVTKPASSYFQDQRGNRVNEYGYRLDSDGNVMYEKDENGSNVAVRGIGDTVRVNIPETVEYYDKKGNRVDQDGYLIDSDGKNTFGLEINGARITGLTKDSTLADVMSAINGNSDAGVRVSYSNLTQQFVFNAVESGENSKISFDDALSKKLFQASNAPQYKTLESVLGSDFAWDEETGKATIYMQSKIGQFPTNLGTFSKTDSLDDLLTALNGVNNGRYKDWLSYDSATGSYTLKRPDGTALDESDDLITFSDGSNKDVSWGAVMKSANTVDSSGATYTAGKNAIVDATVNGKKISGLERTSNTFNMDGMSVTLKDTFTAEKDSDAVTFSTVADADKIVEVVRTFVEDVNKLMSDVHAAYTTQPLTKSTSKREGYEPLSDDDKSSMSETAIKNYEEKAKTGLLYQDSDISSLYENLRNAVQAYGADRVTLESIGLTTSYSSGVTQISLDEGRLRAALESDPDKVRTAFTKSKESGSSTNGLMATLKSTLNTYGSTSLGSQGILVRKAGTKLSAVSLMNNNLQTQINNLTNQIETWQSKMSDRIDYYTKQFTQLEKLMSTMNNQSSMLADLMGY